MGMVMPIMLSYNNYKQYEKNKELRDKGERGVKYANKKYQRDRKAEYPNYGEQLDYIYHNGVTKWKSDLIKPVKDKYPKP